MQIAQGQYVLATAKKSLPLGLIDQAASQQLELILGEAGSSLHGCVEAHQATLERRIEEVKEKMRSKAVQEIIYALVASRMLYAMLARPQEHPCHRLDSMLAISDLIIHGSSKEEDMELVDLLDDALEEFQVPRDKSSEEHPATYDEELMFLLNEALEEFVPTREGSHAAFVVSNEVMAFNDSQM
ncbi:hypothetical protein L7F22_011939 [Adiantum nelumboides]|nr:hypothetical protein [Adiantum nelumboides]